MTLGGRSCEHLGHCRRCRGYEYVRLLLPQSTADPVFQLLLLWLAVKLLLVLLLQVHNCKDKFNSISKCLKCKIVNSCLLSVMQI